MRAAIEVIAEQGWRGATTRAIADRAGVNLALVNYHFGSKKALLLAAVEATLEALVGTMAPEALVDDPAGVLEQSLAQLEHARTDPLMRVVFEVTLEAASDEEIREVTAGFLRDYREQLARALARGCEPDTRTRGRATAIVALLDGLFLHLLVDSEVRPRSALESLRKLLE